MKKSIKMGILYVGYQYDVEIIILVVCSMFDWANKMHL